MKRDMELIREILLAVEADRFEGAIEKFSPEVVEKHTKLLLSEDLIVRSGVGFNGHFTTTTDLTWKGHEFIENLRQREVWNTIKTEFKDESISTMLSVAKKMAEGFAKQKLEKLLRNES